VERGFDGKLKIKMKKGFSLDPCLRNAGTGFAGMTTPDSAKG